MGGPDQAEGCQVGERAGDRPQRADPSKHPAWGLCHLWLLCSELCWNRLQDADTGGGAGDQLGLPHGGRQHLAWAHRARWGPGLPQLDRAVLPPIYRGEDPTVFDEVLLKDGMTENYGSISNEYYDNSKNEKKIDLRIV